MEKCGTSTNDVKKTESRNQLTRAPADLLILEILPLPCDTKLQIIVPRVNIVIEQRITMNTTECETKSNDSMMRGPTYHVIQGFKFATCFSKENIESGLAYQARSDDLFIVTYPKNGTTWSQHIVMLILNDGEIPEKVKENGIYAVSPFLEAEGKESSENLKRPAAIKTHLDYRLQPKHPDAKYIVVLRNAKDACVSFYYHTSMFPSYEFRGRSFGDFFKYWMLGEVECGDYFDWVLSWWNRRHDKNILFILYEDMKNKPEDSVLKIAEFIDPKYKKKLLENDNEILKKVLEKSSFEFMKATVNKTMAKRVNERESNPSQRVAEDDFKFIRKGVIGDWRSHFTEDENRQIEQRFKEKFAGTGLDLLWKEFGIFE
jgi:hypothetical protein